MTGLVDALRGTVRDLIEKRLWPVAVLLLAALIAIPVMIGRGGDAAAPAPGAVVATGPGAAAPPPATASTDRETTSAKTKRGGKVDDPFFDPPPPSAAGATATAAAAAGGSTRAEARSPSGAAAPRGGAAPAKQSRASGNATPRTAKPGATKPGATKPGATKPGATKPRVTPLPERAAAASTYLRTVIRVNGAGGGKPHPITRLTPLGGVADPAAVFLGVSPAGVRHAVFVLGPDATSRGEAHCKAATNCRMIGLKAGETQVVTVRKADGGVRRFTVRVQSITTIRTTASRARAGRAHVHPHGRTVLRDMRGHAATAAALRTARYDRDAGLLRAASPDAALIAPE